MKTGKHKFTGRMMLGGALAALALAACPAAMAEEAASGAQTEKVVVTMDDPMLAPWTGPYGGVPPFDKVDVAKFLPAFDAAIAEAEAEINSVVTNPKPATFENTVAAMERQGMALNRVATLFFVFDSTMSDDAMQEISREVYPKLAAFQDRVAQNEALFKRVEAVYKGSEMKKLSTAQKRLVEDSYKSFVRNGVNLDEAGKARLSEINQRLATLYTTFSQNVLADEEDYVTWVDKKEQLAGLPDSIVAGMASAAEAKGKPGKWAVTNTRSSMEPFLTYADDRALREKVWTTYYSRGDNGDEHDNNGIIREILKLRAERAKLLGYETHAHWRLEPQMAKTPENAMALMMAVWPKAVARVHEEVADMQKIADAEGKGVTIEPWDYRYYAEKVRKAKYDLDMNLVTPYLQLEKLREAMMWAAGELYGLHFKPITDAPVYQPDVRVWEVTDAKGKFKGLWYFDPYARAGKQSGAWMNEYRTQQKLIGTVMPIVSNNANFVKTEDGKPVLISWDDASTLFHEFGHALHGLLSDVKYPSQAGTNVATDFVEFPSQLNEHWLETPEVLNRFALNYETGEPLPAELVEKIENAKTFNQGFATVEYLASALIDMKLHLAGDADIDPDAFERDTLAELGMPKEIVMRHRTPQFGHIFSGDGYSAGYYSYLWSDALTADAAEAFVEAGGFYDEKTAKRYLECVLSAGDTEDQADEFRCFRGRDVDTAALLRKRGFPVD
ncbi:MAG: M3 family metallopeptidase [Parvularculaceae bacterium]